jgi:hypothetical protein
MSKRILSATLFTAGALAGLALALCGNAPVFGQGQRPAAAPATLAPAPLAPHPSTQEPAHRMTFDEVVAMEQELSN